MVRGFSFMGIYKLGIKQKLVIGILMSCILLEKKNLSLLAEKCSVDRCIR